MRLTMVSVLMGMLPVVNGCYGGYREYRYRSERCDPPPVRTDDLGDGRHYRDHHVYYDGDGYEHHYHHIHHYDD
jgi:hypothetical protein